MTGVRLLVPSSSFFAFRGGRQQRTNNSATMRRRAFIIHFLIIFSLLISPSHGLFSKRKAQPKGQQHKNSGALTDSMVSDEMLEMLLHKIQKLESLERKVNELSKDNESSSKKLEGIILEKMEKLESLERKVAELEKMHTERHLTHDKKNADQSYSTGSNICPLIYRDGVYVLDGSLTIKGDLNVESDVLVDGGLLTKTEFHSIGPAFLHSLVRSTGPTHLNDLSVHKSTSILGNLEVKGNVRGNGELSIDGYSQFKEDVYVADHLRVKGRCNFSKDVIARGVDVYGGITVHGSLETRGIASLKGYVSAEKDLHVLGNLDVRNDLKVLKSTYILGNAEIEGSLRGHGELSVDGFSHLQNLFVANHLRVKGLTDLAQQVVLRSNLKVESAIVTKDIMMHGGLLSDVRIYGNTVMLGSLEAKGELDVGGYVRAKDLIVQDNLKVNGLGNFTGQVSMSSNLSVHGVTIVKDVAVDGSLIGDATMQGNVHIVGDLSTEKDFSIMGTSTFRNSVIVEGQTQLGDVAIEGNLKNELSVGDLLVEGDVSIKGHTHMKGGLIVEGEGQFTRRVELVGDAAFDGDVIFNGEVTFSD